MSIRFSAAPLIILLIGAVPAQAGLTFYTDEATFLAELDGVQTETFSVPDAIIEPGMPVTGDVLTIIANGSDNTFDDAGIFSGSLALTVEAAGHTAYKIIGLGGAKAFGGTFQSPQSSQGFGISFDGVTMSLNGMWSDPLGTNFLGWISDGDGADSFTITNNGFEAFTLDNVSYSAALAECPEDLDGDLIVGFDDLLLVLSNWDCTDCAEDLDGDRLVGFGDLLFVLSAWGDCP